MFLVTLGSKEAKIVRVVSKGLRGQLEGFPLGNKYINRWLQLIEKQTNIEDDRNPFIVLKIGEQSIYCHVQSSMVNWSVYTLNINSCKHLGKKRGTTRNKVASDQGTADILWKIQNEEEHIELHCVYAAGKLDLWKHQRTPVNEQLNWKEKIGVEGGTHRLKET